MSRCTTIIICILLISGKQEAQAKIKYGIEEAIDDIGSFIPGAKFVLTTAVKLWSLYGEVRELIEPNTTRIENKLAELEQKLDEISLQIDEVSNKVDAVASDVREIKNLVKDKVIIQLPKQIDLDRKLGKFATLISKVSSMYETFLLYADKEHSYANVTYIQFAEAVVDPRPDQLKDILNQLRNFLVETGGTYNIIDLLANKHLSNTLVCSKEESPLHQMSVLYRDAMLAETKNFLMIQFAYAIKRKLTEDTFESELETAEESFLRRTSQIVKKIKKAMLLAHADYFTCDLQSLEEGKTYATLGPIFQRYIMKEKDFYDGTTRGYAFLDKHVFKGCGGSCRSRKNGTDQCISSYCKYHERKCDGRVINCESFRPELFVCLADKTSQRRYDYLNILDGPDTGKYFGLKKTCTASNIRHIKGKGLVDNKYIECEYCMCTCLIENHKTNVDRYFSLRHVTADVEDNKVVTGVKLTKTNNIFQIQIKQGTLEKNGNIDQKSSKWKDVEEFKISEATDGKDYHMVTWDERSVFLDDLKPQDNNLLLTGLRFQKKEDGIRLEIHITPFDFATGKLDTSQSRWFISPDSSTSRSELSLENRALPTALNYQYLDSTDNQFFKFTTSSVKDDAGQTVVPYIDLQPVETDISLPLAGAGLIHKGNNEDSAGFLALKLFSYNYADHLEA